MHPAKEISDELKNVAPTLANIDFQHTYQVPHGYFDSFPERILLRIRLENAGSAAEELQIISPLLSGLSKKMHFTTPQGYFETLAPAITLVKKEQEHKAGRVIKMFQPQRTLRVAAAAVTIGIISLAAWFFMKSPSGRQYATKTDIEIQKELKNKVGELSEKELSNFIEGSTVITSYDNTNIEDIGEEDVKLMLADISDQELEKFVDQNAVKEKFN
ncbi:MAG TPA: hypothetical protein VM101_10840 [Flavitalea sp.]|nr:hypothetical protein [Flavitalea sp.]